MLVGHLVRHLHKGLKRQRGICGLGMGGGGKGSGNGSWTTSKEPKEWSCKWCHGPDGSRLRNDGDRKSCRSCSISKCYSFHFQNSETPAKPSTSMADRQIAAEKAENRKQLAAQKKRIDHLEKQLAAKGPLASEEEVGLLGFGEVVNPSKLVAKQQRTQKLLAEAQAEGWLGGLDIGNMPWTKLVVPVVAESAESLHKQAKGKYNHAWGRWKRGSVAVEEARALLANLEQQLEAAKVSLLKQEEEFRAADAALSEAAKLVEGAAAKQAQEKAEGEKDEQMPGQDEDSGKGRKKAVAGAEEKALLANFNEELLTAVRGDTEGSASEEASKRFIESCSTLFLNLQKLVAGQRAAAAVASEPAQPVGAEPRGSPRSRSRSPLRGDRAASLPSKEADCL